MCRRKEKSMTLQSGWVAPGIFLLTVKTINRKHKRSLWVGGRVAAAALSAAAPGGAAAHAQLRGVGQMQPAWQGVAGPGVRWTTGMCTAHPGRTRRCATTLSTPPACHAPRGGPCTTGGAGAPRRVTSRPQALADLGSAARTLTATAPEEQSPRCAQDLSLLSHNAAGLGERGRHTASAARREPTSHMHSPDGTDQSSLARTPKHSRSLWLSDASQNETQHGH